ncbi:unnamed protein product [Anisakis simplex]|uniref:Uncharacterized protein n=1 Tax=Anisakis simplex TaxID=6269 RepID=A0A0M3JQM9_ANISI|nr:unnamed protein product [Anisakis simplex]
MQHNGAEQSKGSSLLKAPKRATIVVTPKTPPKKRNRLRNMFDFGTARENRTQPSISTVEQTQQMSSQELPALDPTLPSIDTVPSNGTLDVRLLLFC